MHRETVTSPGQILDIANAYWRSSALHAAVRLDLFDRLGSQRKTAGDIALAASLHAPSLELLLNALTAMGLLVKEGDLFANTEASSLFLCQGGEGSLTDIILHHHHLVDGWNQLADAVRSGNAVEMKSFGDEEERRRFLLGMHNLASLNAARIVKHVNLSGRRKLLDLGGGPGTYSLAFCLTNPGLHAVIFDRPTSEPYTERVRTHPDVAGRIAFVGGDFLHDPLPEGNDVVWVSHILHSLAPETCAELLRKAVATLAGGGQLYVHDFILNDTKAGPLFPALFSLNMLINNGQGRSYSAGELVSLMEESGLHGVHRLSYQGPNDGYILCGSRP
ncbi:MAG: methyltransferase [Thermodesulfobacteriota bacterium]